MASISYCRLLKNQKQVEVGCCEEKQVKMYHNSSFLVHKILRIKPLLCLPSHGVAVASHWAACFLFDPAQILSDLCKAAKILLNAPLEKKRFARGSQPYIFLRHRVKPAVFRLFFVRPSLPVFISVALCAGARRVNIALRSSYSAIIHLAQRQAAAAGPCLLRGFEPLAATTDRPQLTLAHTATFQPGRARRQGGWGRGLMWE